MIVELTPSLYKVAKLIPSGMSNKDIAAHTNLSPQVVKNYLVVIMDKCGADNRTILAVLLTSGAVVIKEREPKNNDAKQSNMSQLQTAQAS